MSLNWAVVVEYMDRAQGPTVDFFAQNVPVTLAWPTKLSPASLGRRTYGKPVGARELMFKSTGGYPMAT